MRVSCRVCGTDYVVSDSRLAGRERRAHCGKCNATFVIDGRGMCAPGSEDDDDVWLVRHYVQSELSHRELLRSLEDGDLTLRGTVVWKRGMVDWVPAAALEELARHASADDRRTPSRGRSPAPPTVATLDMALSRTSADGPDTPLPRETPERGRPPLSEHALHDITPLSESSPAIPSVRASSLSEAILRASTPPGGLSPRIVTKPLRQTSTSPSTRRREEAHPYGGGAATALAEPWQDDSRIGTGISGARRIELSERDSERAPRVEMTDSERVPSDRSRSRRAPAAVGGTAPGGKTTPESIRSPAPDPSANEDARNARHAPSTTRLLLMAVAGFVGCLALLHQFGSGPDEPPIAPPNPVSQIAYRPAPPLSPAPPPPPALEGPDPALPSQEPVTAAPEPAANKPSKEAPAESLGSPAPNDDALRAPPVDANSLPALPPKEAVAPGARRAPPGRPGTSELVPFDAPSITDTSARRTPPAPPQD